MAQRDVCALCCYAMLPPLLCYARTLTLRHCHAAAFFAATPPATFADIAMPFYGATLLLPLRRYATL